MAGVCFETCRWSCFETYVVFRNARLPITHYRLNITYKTVVSQSDLYPYIYKYGQASGVTSVRTDSTPHWCPLRFTKSSRVKAPKASRILNSWCIPLCHIELCYLSYILFKICYCPLSHSSWRFCKCIQKCDTMYHLYTFDYIRNRTGIYCRLCCRL